MPWARPSEYEAVGFAGELCFLKETVFCFSFYFVYKKYSYSTHMCIYTYIIYIYIYILEIGWCELAKVPPNREMLCKRCEHVSECECNVIREGVALVVRSF